MLFYTREFVKSVEENKNIEDISDYIPSNTYDPAQWEHVDTKLRDLLVEKGPIRYSDINFPKDENSRHFSTTYISQLANEGTDDWKNLSAKFKIHETTNEHITNMTAWLNLEMRLLRNKTIDKRIYQENNGNFLSLIKMISEFDPVMQEHIRRIQDGEIHNHYLATELKNHITKKIKEAKYFSIILDCTLDASHQEQIPIKIEEHFLEFIKVDYTSRKFQSIYYLFSSSTKQWKILQDKVLILTLKPLSQTSWETLLQLEKMTEDLKTKSEANCLVAYKIENFEFILDMTIYKSMQSKDMYIDVAIDQLKCLISYFQDYRENEFKSAMISLKEIAINMEIEPLFREKITYFLFIVDQAISSIQNSLESFLKYDIDEEILPIEESTLIDILNYIKRLDSFSNTSILSIGKEILEELEYKNLISNFASQKTRRIIFK
ncbi:hypothetical protein I3843_03G128800 [Carya illinoinensis]|uniref:DUF4371 domain-containing protein n=1 Tax=Carya illinoinensis TaxID=32201 RepID=A0A922JUZ5_CARIL|nr:hypothetical protein I3842_03G129000 [Carya illinoinensis]KAG7987341.1 hypothetical protein I3843_03G128800 [Carya illinoinensis]